MTTRSRTNLEGNPRHESRGSSSLPQVPQLASLLAILRRNQDLVRNAGSLAATTGLTSLFGFAFWIYAARVFSSDAVGYGSAAISTMMLLAMIGLFGLDTMLMGELPRGGNRGGLIMAACIASAAGSFVLGLGWAVVSLAFGTHFAELNGTIGRMLIFSIGVGITAATLVFDSATIGLMRGGLQLSRNTAVSIAKMAVLPAAALILHDGFGVGIVLAWVVGTFISLIPVAVMTRRSGSTVLHRPDWATLWRLRKLALAHNWLNLAITVPGKLIPVLVAVVVSPSSNGAYYIATMISGFLFMVPQSLSTVLFAAAAAAPEQVAEKLRFVLRTSCAVAVPVGLVMAIFAHPILSIFNPAYATLATGPLIIMIVQCLPGLPSQLYIAVSRVQGRFGQAAVFLIIFAALRMIALVIGAKIDGLYGLSYAMLGVTVMQALITTPTVLRVAYGHLTVAAQGLPKEAPRPVEVAGQTRVQQEAGLAALVALATRISGLASAPVPNTETSTVVASSRAQLADLVTRQPPSVGMHRRPRRPSGVSAALTRANPVLRTTSWFAALDDSFTRPSRQEAGMAALIEVATQAAKY